MYFSRIALNTARRGSWRLLRSPHAMHAAVLAAFPPDAGASGEGGRVLWRVDRPQNATWLYLVSPSVPDLTHIVEQAGWPTQATWETREYSPFLSRLRDGQHWRFRLVANPVHAVHTPDGSTKRFGHVTVAQQQSWLEKRAQGFGFRIPEGPHGPDLIVSGRERKTFRRNGATVTLDTARFDGQLEVTDADALRRSLAHGIGRAKGYGCGLLTLAPALARADR